MSYGKDWNPVDVHLQLLHAQYAQTYAMDAMMQSIAGNEATAAVYARLAAHEAFLAFPALKREVF